jgi:curli biogenesis system outer membrane secretion channel CsgG
MVNDAEIRSRIAAYGVWMLLAGMILTGCAVTSARKEAVEAPIPLAEQAAAQKSATAVTVKTLKRKIAIARFSNETRYGRTFQTDASLDPLGKQASDMLATGLVGSQKFLVFERPDLSKIKAEQSVLKESNLIGVDTLVLGSVTEFGRSTAGKRGFLSSTKVQTARAKVEIRLVDARTGYVFFTATGTGEASTESGEVAGFGSKADYDGSLNDRAIGAAISDVQNALIAKLEERPWRTDILKVDGRQLYLSGGAKQGIKVGDKLSLMEQVGSVKSGQTGFNIELPPKLAGQLQVVSLFGDNETNEGAVAELLSGNITEAAKSGFFVSESKE